MFIVTDYAALSKLIQLFHFYILLLIDSIGQIVDLVSGCQSALTICKTVPLFVKAIFIRPGDLIVWFYDCNNKFAGFLIRVIFQNFPPVIFVLSS